MNRNKRSWLAPALSGGAAGIVNGFFGGGGGMILVPLLAMECSKAFGLTKHHR